MEINDLRIGNYYHWTAEGKNYPLRVDVKDFTNENYKNFEPIRLTEDILLNCPSAKKLNFPNILNTIYFEIGRNRVISIGNVGTPNEAIWLCCVDENIKDRITDLVCIHNYDYDGKIMLHNFQNLYKDLSKTELEIKL